MVAPDVSATAASGASVRPTWSSFREAVAVVLYPQHLRRSLGVAAVVGSILFVINQLGVVLAHHASSATYLKGALTFLVPFCVSNYGILVATRRLTESPAVKN